MKKPAKCFTQTGLKRPRSSAIPPCFPSAPGGRETGAGWTCLVSDKEWEDGRGSGRGSDSDRVCACVRASIQENTHLQVLYCHPFAL